MSGITFSKFFWSDWRSDPGLRSCSLAARGLWIDMLCIAAEAQPTGYVLVNGRTLTTTDLARLTGAPEADVQSALAELDAAGVFSRDSKGRIYSRRMLRDMKAAVENRRNGKMGGNPALCNDEQKSAPVNPTVKGDDKPHYPSSITTNTPQTPQGGPSRNRRVEGQPGPVVDAPWEQRCRGWAKGYRWDPFWGPPPDEPGCYAPADLVADARRKRVA